LMHNQNYETNPRSAALKREDAVSDVRFSASKRQKAGLNLLPNEPNVGQAFPVYGNCETALEFADPQKSAIYAKARVISSPMLRIGMRYSAEPMAASRRSIGSFNGSLLNLNVR